MDRYIDLAFQRIYCPQFDASIVSTAGTRALPPTHSPTLLCLWLLHPGPPHSSTCLHPHLHISILTFLHISTSSPSYIHILILSPSKSNMVTTVVWPARQTPSAEVVFEKQKHTSTYLSKLYLWSKI